MIIGSHRHCSKLYSPAVSTERLRPATNDSTKHILELHEEKISKGIHHLRVKANQRDFLKDVLGASTTRRDARSYLSRFKSGVDRSEFKQQHQRSRSRNTVNLGNLFGADKTEVLHGGSAHNDSSEDIRHIAIVLIRELDRMSDETLHGVTRTLSHLSQLGMHCVVMLDLRDYLSIAERRLGRRKHSFDEQETRKRSKMQDQADRIINALESRSNQKAQRLEYLFKTHHHSAHLGHLDTGRFAPHVNDVHLLKRCFESNVIPIVLPFLRTGNMKMRVIHTKQALIALSRTLAGTADFVYSADTIREKVSNAISTMSLSNCSVDRIIVLDTIGGIPAEPLSNKPHIFINLEQEYDDIMRDLSGIHNNEIFNAKRVRIPQREAARRHMINLSLVRRTLKFLPPSSSALIISPEAIAREEHHSNRSVASSAETGSRRNVLIHNILTDKPIRSSSLPASRMDSASKATSADNSRLSATFLKHGMPLTVVPDPRLQPWKPPTPDVQILSLQDPRLDIGRLVNLIEDSFGRPLNQKEYFSRIAPSMAGVIIAGAYEGGAILTWERPKSAVAGDVDRLVPYLDKFAVLKRSQGAGGVADIVFSAMVRDCFPQGVCWRSRSNNPVNKWYFERARGTYKLRSEATDNASAQSWTMFWTTKGIQEQVFNDYEEVCRSIKSSWADGKQTLD